MSRGLRSDGVDAPRNGAGVVGHGTAPWAVVAHRSATVGRVTILIDPPNSPGHGRLWSHVASDESFEELHAFAAAAQLPRRGFDRDHYDVPEEWYDAIVAAGAHPVSSRELVARLVAAGLRRRRRARPVH
jgi:hypothetical protein